MPQPGTAAQRARAKADEVWMAVLVFMGISCLWSLSCLSGLPRAHRRFRAGHFGRIQKSTFPVGEMAQQRRSEICLKGRPLPIGVGESKPQAKESQSAR